MGNLELPSYLRPYVAEQRTDLYTPIDHAAWRFIMKLSRKFFAQHAHRSYLEGLEKTGISVDRIPTIQEMDEKLARFGWRAVPICGFIPPAAFMEFLSLGVLPIACDMRKLENLSYTPAPDIVHEAAGHAPIIADPGYADYLHAYGEISQKAIFSSEDMDLYLAIRELSDIKEDPASTVAQIEAAQKNLDETSRAVSFVSEAMQLARMSWWTIEYGLVGSVEQPKIYGAGLLSSLSEGFHSLDPEVRKIPLTVDCIETTYDITKPQPQLFVAKDFASMKQVLEDLSARMAFRLGGALGLARAKQAKTVNTVEFENGIQVSGKLVDWIESPEGQPAYLRFEGPSQISFKGHEIGGQSAKYHHTGFGCPVGMVRTASGPKSVFDLTDAELRAGKLVFESGVTIEGKLSRTDRDGKGLLFATFQPCKVTLGSRTLFEPAWGPFDLVGGARVASVFGGAADRGRYLADTGGFEQPPNTHKTNLTPENAALNALYGQVRAIRDGAASREQLAEIHAELQKTHPEDWLLRYELLELAPEGPHAAGLRKELERIGATSRDRAELIHRGLEALT